MSTVRRVRSWKAQPVAAGKIQDLELYFDTEVHANPDDHKGAAALYRAEGVRLVNALLAHLPGGLVDAIFGVLAERKASILVVPHEAALYALPDRKEVEELRTMARAFRDAEREGNDTDDPEGARFVRMSDTFACSHAARLERIADSLDEDETR